MNCPQCNANLDEVCAFCPSCGFSFASEREHVEETIRAEHFAEKQERIAHWIRGPLFLAICILVSIATFMSLVGQVPSGSVTVNGLPVFEILYTIFLWIAYGKGQCGTLGAVHLRNISGTAFAYCVVQYVLGGILLALSTFLPNLVFSDQRFRQTLIAELEKRGIEFFKLPFDLFEVMQVVFIVALVVAGLFAILLTLFGFRYIHRFAKSLHRRFADGETPLVSIGSARGWLIVFGVFQCLGALASTNNFWVLIAKGCLGAALFVGSALVARISGEPE